MSLSPLYITFEQHQVVVETAIPDVHSTLRRWFYAMLEPEPSLVVHQVTIWQEAGNYLMQSGDTVREVLQEQLNVLPEVAPAARPCKLNLLLMVKYEIIMGLVRTRPDLLWFHAGAVANDMGAVVFAAPGGGGKSTLVAQLCQQGWYYLSDDVMPFELTTGNILPFPQTPRVRQNTGELVPSDRLSEVPKFDVALDLNLICRTPIPIRAIIFPSFDRQISAQISPCSPGTTALELLRNCINFTDHKQAALQQICKIVKHLPAFHLSFSHIDCAIECLTQRI